MSYTLLSSTIDQINTRSKCTMYDPSHVRELSDKFDNLGIDLTYIGHGVQAICFSIKSHLNSEKYDFDVKNNVLKCCKKTSSSIMCNSSTFDLTVAKLLGIGVPILNPVKIIHETDYWLVYVQPMCKPITNNDITSGMCCQILSLIEKMIKYNVRISDIFFKNFGIYKNNVVLFDFHDVDTFTTASPNFMITNLYSLFIQLGDKIGWNVSNILITNIHSVIFEQFGENMFPLAFSQLLHSLYNRNFAKAIICIRQAIEILEKDIKGQYIAYQQVDVNNNGMIDLKSHTFNKYKLAMDIIQKNGYQSVLEARSCVGGIGLKIAKDVPHLAVDMCNVHQNELDQSQKIANHCLIFNINVINSHITQFTPTKKYDLVMYYSLIHHLLKTMTIVQIIDMIKTQMGKCCIIEVPILDLGDYLLSNVIHHSIVKENFSCIESIQTFRKHLIDGGLKVEKCVYIDYDDPKLNRYGFICSFQ
jgi:hypothetical protein